MKWLSLACVSREALSQIILRRIFDRRDFAARQRLSRAHIEAEAAAGLFTSPAAPGRRARPA